MEDLVAIAKIIKPRGLRGEVVADILTDFPERFDRLDDAIVLFPDGTRKDLKIDNAFFQKDRVVLTLSGVNSPEAAETFRNAEICVRETEAAQLDEGEFFDWQLEGCDVVTSNGDRLGTVREVMRTGGTEVLVVDGPEKEYLIPFAESICTEVDIDKKTIVVDPPEGLLEF